MNYYHTLGVSASATVREIKLAYKKLAIQYHPDKHQGNTYFEEKFKQVNEAYQVLSDPHKRAAYDLKLQYLLQLKMHQQAGHQQYRYQGPVRRPSSVSERHYRPIPQSQFIKKDWYIVGSIFGGIIIFSLILKLIMDHVTAVDNYEKALVEIGEERWSSAHAHLTEAIYFKPSYAAAYMQRAYIEMEVRQDYPAALADLDATIENAEVKTAKMYYLRSKCFQELRNYTSAEADLTNAIQINRNFTQAFYDRGMLRARLLNKFPEAIKDFTQSLRLGLPEAAMRKDALYYRGFSYYLTLQNNAALQDYRQVLRQDKENARVYFLIGKVQVEIDSTAAACQNFEKAFNLGYQSAMGDIQRYCRDTDAASAP
ncbi:tetratricopeptide repeat protein [Adhaeribacter aerolatus]|uniref:tetratricopeptide repeat protein n=1 Tax=Adhaeribacter aerolatus TaxID=670289 RepID=UPI0027D97CF1|nr:DnaJ domain-containing protein [Adhaeribacter aerolatus]